MKTYLQRLAERAEGVSLTSLISPTVRNEVRDGGSDSSKPVRDERSLALDAESSDRPIPAVAESAVDEHERVQRAERGIAPNINPRVEVPVTVGLSRSESPDLAEIQPEPAPVVQPRSAGDETAIHQHLEPRKEIAPPERSIIEVRSTEREQPPPLEVERDSPVARTSPTLSPAQYVDEPFTKGRQSNTDQRRRSDQPNQDVQQGLLSPIQRIERLVPTAKEIGAAAVSDRPVPNLEPSRAEPIRQTVPNSGEPRLVIGQLRVDILPAAPAETREVVRVAQRRASASRPVRANPVSNLRFGLRQM